MKNNSRAAKFELALIGVVAIVFALVELLYIDSLQVLVTWAAQNEALLVAEVFTFAVVLSVGLSIYSWHSSPSAGRRCRE